MADIRQLTELLELIDERVDLGHCAEVDDRYRRALSYEPVERPPLTVQPAFGTTWELPPPYAQFPHYSYRKAFDSPVAMLQNMLLARVVPGLLLKDDSPLAIRNDHGTVQIASLLGGQWHFHEDNYPWVSSLGSTDAIEKLIARDDGIDLNGGVMPQSTKTLRFYNEQLARFPNVKNAVQISLPDLQGPIDTADILWGSEIFAEILANPQLVSAMMTKVTDAMLQVIEYYRQFVVDKLDPLANTQHGYNIPGRLMIRNDSAIMVSPGTYREMVLPHDARVLKEVGGGSLHFCGNGEHLIEPMLEIPDLRGIDLGEPELMDVQRMYRMCAERKVALTHLRPSREDLVTGNAIKAYPTGVAFVYYTDNIKDACDVVTRYNQCNQ
jgi:hypothetical protein